MRIKRILSGLLVGIMVLGMVNTSVFAVSGEKEVLSNVPFDYMTNMKNRSLDSYEGLSTGDKKLVYTIPNGVAETLTTEALLETILNNKYLTDLMAYDDFAYAVKVRNSQYKILDYLNRKDALTVLDAYIVLYENRLKQKEKEAGFYIDDVTNWDFELSGYEDVLTNYLQIVFMNELKNNYSEIMGLANGNSQNLSRGTQYFVETKAGNLVEGIKDRTWLNALTNYGIQCSLRGDYRLRYPNNVELEGADCTPKYNCHSYAWYSNNIETNNIWIEKPASLNMYYSESTPCNSGPQIGWTKVLYYDEDGGIAHSAKVYAVYSNNTVASVISKWGNNSVYIHTLEDSPYYYSGVPIVYRNY